MATKSKKIASTNKPALAEDSETRKLIGIRLSPEIIKKLKRFALENDRSLNSLLNEGVTDLLKKYKIKE